jgi:hypothetical protein
MDFFELIGLIVFLYYALQIVLWIALDCDIGLFVASQWGRPIGKPSMLIELPASLKTTALLQAA